MQLTIFFSPSPHCAGRPWLLQLAQSLSDTNLMVAGVQMLERARVSQLEPVIEALEERA